MKITDILRNTAFFNGLTEQQLHELKIARLSGKEKRGLTILVCGVDISTLCNKKFYHFYEALSGCTVKRCPSLLALQGVDICSLC